MHRWILGLAALCLLTTPSVFALAATEPVPVDAEEATGPEVVEEEAGVVMPASGEMLWATPVDQAIVQAGLWRAEEAKSEGAPEGVEEYGNCSVSITCPGAVLPFITIPPYTASCQGNRTCSIAYSGGQPCAVVCDGFGQECFPNGCF